MRSMWDDFYMYELPTYNLVRTLDYLWRCWSNPECLDEAPEVCPECGYEPLAVGEGDSHAMTKSGRVLVGCEGYFTIRTVADVQHQWEEAHAGPFDN